MKDSSKLNRELLSKSLKLIDVLNVYALPNSEEIHNMICGYSYVQLTHDTRLFDVAESIDYFRYEKELCKQSTKK